MSKTNKTFEKVMSGNSDANLSFDELCFMLQHLGYTMRSTKGSHVIFVRGTSFVNLQNQGGKAKSYQVRQVRVELKKLNLGP